MAGLNYLTKLKKDLGPAFDAHFLHDPYINILTNVPYLMFYQLTKFHLMSYFFCF